MRFFLFFLTFLTSLFAQSIEAKYKVTYGFLGEVGYSKAKFVKNSNSYKIEVTAKATGLAKILSNGRKERYISEGVVKNGILIPKIYKKIRENSKKKDIKIYRFDHDKKKIYVHIERYRDKKLDTKKDEILNYYAKDDILSLYFNLKKYVNLKDEKGKKSFFAVGGNRKDGKVDVEIPKGENLKKIKKLLGEEDGLFLIVTIYQKIFASKKGKLYIVLNDKGIAKKALLKDVILFGDITGILEKLEIGD